MGNPLLVSVDSDTKLPPAAVMVALQSGIASTLAVTTSTTDAQVASWLNSALPGTVCRLVGSMTTTAGFDIPNNVTLDGYGATITAAAASNAHTIRLGNGSGLIGLKIISSAVTAATYNAVEISSKTDALVRDVAITGSKRCGIEVANSTRYNLVNNKIRNSAAQAINIVNSDAGVVTGNYIDTALHGIQFWGGDSSTSSTIGIRNVLIANNNVSNVTGGIWGSLGQGIAITGNHVENCADVGIDFEGCQDSTATGNTVRNATTAGLSVFYGSVSCTFTGNTVINDTAAGFGFKAATSKTNSGIRVVGNTFRCTNNGVITADTGAITDSAFANNTMVTTKSGQSGFVTFNCSNLQVRGNRITVYQASGIVNVGGPLWNVDDNDINTTSDTSAAADTVAGVRMLWQDGTNNAQNSHIHGNRIWGFNKGIVDDCGGDNTSHAWIKDNQVNTIRYRGTYGNGYYGIIESNRQYTDPNTVTTSSAL
ncbi:right-handed parallel beta-helix repeat-containing protein [Curtobacterium sp. PhB78]|uniref:right-handed parallel beta-helix repeat-containing protein n=1 Tax=Curtobacterium sp. PhB78 TaxID=2485102 RepID=UPI000F46ED5E|nr:right-handed parallel beta-helix repeat-containing protein [Curtobacterium sp. PhB78]ROS34531.1 parallel beta-helix repeat protein [Curtobacterium sp. PhB78]